MCRANRAVGPTLAAVETAASTSAAVSFASALATKATYLPAWRECTAPPTPNAAIPYLWRHGACIRCKPMG